MPPSPHSSDGKGARRPSGAQDTLAHAACGTEAPMALDRGPGAHRRSFTGKQQAGHSEEVGDANIGKVRIDVKVGLLDPSIAEVVEAVAGSE